MTDEELSRAVAEVAGYTLKPTKNGKAWWRICPEGKRFGRPLFFEDIAWRRIAEHTIGFGLFARSLDAIAAEERRAGIRVRIVEGEADWMVQACWNGEGDPHIAYDLTEARARCRAFLAVMEERKS